MNAFVAFLQADWAERAGWTLLHSLWQIAAVAAVYAIVAMLLGRRSANSRYLLGCVAIFFMLGLPVGTYALLSRAAPLEVGEASTGSVVAALPAEQSVRLPEGTLNSLGDPVGSTFDSEKVVAEPVKVVAERPVATDLSSAIRHCLPWVTAVWLVASCCSPYDHSWDGGTCIVFGSGLSPLPEQCWKRAARNATPSRKPSR